MNASLSAVWQEVTDLLTLGISVIPVRDREQNGFLPKTPYAEWKTYQSTIISPVDLWHQMEEHNTSAIAIICGEISGNLEAIDIDVKYWPGIDGIYFHAIESIYPDLFSRLRIHSTPSGGFHILYRVVSPTGIGNQKLASQASSPKAGIETRGEGGYVVAPPSLGYRVYHDVPIPIITNDQRDSLIALAKSLNERIKPEVPVSLPKQDLDLYDQNPFEHYNATPEAERVLLDHGWTAEWSNNSSKRYQYFIRPGKSRGISASFDRELRLYHIFTTSTDLEADRSYQPATLLSHLDHKGDKRATYHALVSQGYGKLKPAVEKSIVRDRARRGEEIPANASPEAIVIYEETTTELKERYPFGVFWDQTKHAITMNREQVDIISRQLGFRTFHGEAVRIRGHIVSVIAKRQYFDVLHEYASGDQKVYNALASFLQRSGQYTYERLPEIDTSLFLRSTKSVSYKFFSNGYLEITADSITLHPYTDLDGRLIWDTQILNRPFHLEDISPDGLYYQFLNFAVGYNTYTNNIIGFLTHEFKDETTPYIIVLLEQSQNPKDGGGTGKNLFINLLSHTTTVKTLPGAQVHFDEKFLQPWNFERVLAISDLYKTFNYSFLKELSSGTGTLKKLFHNERTVPVEDMPKIVLSTNFSFDNVDGGLKRRLIPIEFTSFFHEKKGVDVYFGKMFPYDWSAADFSQYDNIIVRAIQSFIQADCKLAPSELTETGWTKQFEITNSPAIRQFITEYFDLWLRTKFVPNDMFKLHYERFCNENSIPPKFQASSFKLNNALEEWCNHHNVSFTKDHMNRVGLEQKRGKLFEKLEPAPF